MGPAMRRNKFHPGILDPQLLLKEGDLAVPAVDLALQANLTILTLGRPRSLRGRKLLARIG